MGIDSTDPVHVEVLVVDRWLLKFNLILRNNAIRVAGGITIMPAGVVSFAEKKVTECLAICPDETGFCVEFNQMQNRWTAK